MATQDRSPSLFAGQPWTVWEEQISLDDVHDSKSTKQPETTSGDNDSMKLRSDDMSLFGICPSQDEFYLVVCEKCNQVVKPQAFRRHMEHHHGLKNIKGSRCRASSSQFNVPSKSPSLVATTKDSSHNASLSTHPMPPTKASLKLPPPSIQSHINKLSNSDSGKPNNFKKSNTLPVVKVERISDSSVNVKKTLSMNHDSGKKSALTNGSVKTENGSTHVNATMPSPTLSVPTPHKPAITLTFTTTTVTTTTLTKTLSSVTPTVLSTQTSSAVLSTSVVSSQASTVSAGGGSSNKKSPKERKFLPCKDREFDPDKHCGCWIADINKQCTRSLTCKTHALSLRRAVKCRSKTFDELLKEHRAAKEALLKAKAEQQAKSSSSSSGTGPGGGHGGTNKSSHTNSNTHIKDGSSLSSALPPTSPQKNIKPKIKPQNTVFQRLTSSDIYPHSVLKEEDTPSHDASARVSVDSEADAEEMADVTYFPYHPQPAAVCRFNARNNGSGCYTFSRKVDYMRAAFRSALERHLHPPAHKKLCVESKLPKEPHIATNSKDPYDFNLMDTSGVTYASINSGVVNSSHKIVAMKPKSKISTSTCAGNKSPKATLGSKSPGTTNMSSVCGSVNPIKRKRSGSGQGVVNATSLNTTVASASQLSNIFGNIATIANTNSPITAIAIPNFGGTTLGHFNATLTSNKQIQVPKNNIIKDFNLVLTGIDPSMINGQVMNITTAQLADFAAQAQLVGRVSSADDKSAKRSRIIGANSKHSPTTAKLSTTNLDTFKTLQSNSVIVPQNAVLVDNSLQGHVLTGPVSLATSGGSTIVSLGNATVTPPQASPSSTPSPMFRTDSVCPQVSSSLPNGVVSSSSDHKAAPCQRASTNITKHTKAGLTMNITPGLLHTSGQVGSQLCTSQGITTAQLCTGQSLTASQLSQLQMKPAQINMSKNVGGKITVQPVSVTIPIVNQASFNALATQQGQQRTLFMTTSTNDGPSKQELHLQPQISNSPSNLIS